MTKLTRLTEKEDSGEQSLSGLYHITMDVHVDASKGHNINVLKELAKTLGDVEDIYVEKYAEAASPFNIGDTIELTTEFNCDKAVYVDTQGNLVISDKLVTEAVEKIGTFTISLPEGTIAEINSKGSEGTVEVLFTGETVYLEKLNRAAYLGILELPADCLKSI